MRHATTRSLANSGQWLRTRDLLLDLVVRDIKLRYRGSVLGVLWTLVNPLAELLVLLFVFGRVMRVEIPNFPAYLFTGLIVYGWFQTSLNFATTSIVGNRELVRRPGVPTAVLPVVTVASNMVHFVLSLPILAVLLIFSGVPFTSAVLSLPLLMAIEFVFIVGCAYPIAVAHVWFRDTQHVLRVALQLLFYMTPVFWLASTAPEPMRWVYTLNPMAQIIDAYRGALMWGQWPGMTTLAALSAVSIAMMGMGLFLFHRVSHLFPDEL